MCQRQGSGEVGASPELDLEWELLLWQRGFNHTNPQACIPACFAFATSSELHPFTRLQVIEHLAAYDEPRAIELMMLRTLLGVLASHRCSVWWCRASWKETGVLSGLALCRLRLSYRTSCAPLVSQSCS